MVGLIQRARRTAGLGQFFYGWNSSGPILLTLALLLAVCDAAAQGLGRVSGTLLDAASQQPLPFAGVVLLRAADSSFVAGAQTLETGAFTLEKVPLGRYVLKATVVGYRTGLRPVALTAAAPTLALGPLRLRTAATKLAEVLVQGQRAIVTDNLDKKVIDVTKDLNAAGGTAVDVLQNVPSVSVDQNGAVSLRGAAGVKVLVDGKPTSVPLDQLPASSIQTIEVITNPSARYDAEGTAGIVNIVLKKQRQEGWNGQASATAGTGAKYNPSLNLNYRRGRINAFGAYDFRADRRTGYGTVRQRTSYRDTTVVLSQDRTSLIEGRGHTARLGLDYDLTPDHTLTLTVQPRFNRQHNQEDIRSAQLNQATGEQPVLGNSDRANLNTGTSRQADFSLDYRRLWPSQKQRELTATVIYTPGITQLTVNSDVAYRDNPAGHYAHQQQYFDVRTDQAAAQLDYVLPVGEKGRYELGAKSLSRRSDNDFQYRSQPGLAYDPSNRFIYQEYIQSAYGIYGNAAGAFSYKLGLRVEQTNTRGDQAQATPNGHFTRSYLSLFPSALLAYDFSDAHRLQLSYSRRVQRPSADELDPFPDRSDPLSLRSGNPGLRPEFVHALELGEQTFFGAGGQLSGTAFYRYEENTITNIRDPRFYDVVTQSTVANTVRLNVGHEISYGLEAVAAAPLGGRGKVSLNSSAFRRIIQGSTPVNADFNNRNLVFSARLNTTLAATKKLDVQLAANYRSPVVTAQGRRLTQFNVDLAAKQLVLKDKGAITLRLADVFNTLQFNNDASGPGFDSQTRNKRESRILYLGFSYRFGVESAARKAPKPDSGDEGKGFE